jgi:hypothetical protein
MMKFPNKIEIVPRDGLQNLKDWVPKEDKIN